MLITMLPDVALRRRRVAVGEFDGVHLGHREVIRGSDTVLTFEPHPRAVLSPDAAPKLLTTLEQKADLVAEIGVEELVVLPFDDEFARREPRTFVDDVLVGALGAERVAVGENFRFGHRALGDPALLRTDGRFELREVALVEIEGEIISSSRIRGLVSAGEVDHAAVFLGHPFELRGPVVHGEKRGRDLGFPTANLVPDDAYACPGHGVYAAFVDGRPAAVNVGVRPTFETGLGLLVEAHVIDWEGDLYGTELRLEFVARLRGERRFESPEALAAQMERDVARALALCAG